MKVRAQRIAVFIAGLLAAAACSGCDLSGRIASPHDGDAFYRNQEITFQAHLSNIPSEGIDYQDVVWSSDKDGEIGRGLQFASSDLSEAAHTITLSYTGGSGAKTWSRISITVSGCPAGFAGEDCDSCAVNHYDYPSCAYCQRADTCSNHGTCNSAGSCVCDAGFAGSACDHCAANYYPASTCNVYCSAASTCSGHGTCNNDGSCICDSAYNGAFCNTCSSGHYGYPLCAACPACQHGYCDSNTGACICNDGYSGALCETAP